MTPYRLPVRAYTYPDGVSFRCVASWDPLDPHALRLTFGTVPEPREWLIAIDLFRPGHQAVPGADAVVRRPFYWRSPDTTGPAATRPWVRLDLHGEGPDASLVLDHHALDRVIRWADTEPHPELDLDAAIRELLDGYQH